MGFEKIGTRLAGAFLLVLTVAACGVDGPPERPAAKTGVSVGGTIEIGVTGGNG